MNITTLLRGLILIWGCMALVFWPGDDRGLSLKLDHPQIRVTAPFPIRYPRYVSTQVRRVDIQTLSAIPGGSGGDGAGIAFRYWRNPRKLDMYLLLEERAELTPSLCAGSHDDINTKGIHFCLTKGEFPGHGIGYIVDWSASGVIYNMLIFTNNRTEIRTVLQWIV